MQSYQIKSELNVLVNSTNNKLDNDMLPFCRKKLDFQTPGEKKTESIQSFELNGSIKKSQFGKAPSNSKRNARERRRVRTINDYFSQLQKFLPHTKQAANGLNTIKKMSKVETLKAAIEYIEYLIKFAPANCQQLFQLSKAGSASSSLMSSPASSVCSNSTQILAEKFKTTLNKNCSSPSKVTPSSPSTIQNTSTCSTPKSSCTEPVYANSQTQYQNAYPANYYNYSECNYYSNSYYYNNQGYNGYPDNYENSNSFNGYYPNDAGVAQINIQMSPVNKSNMSSCSSSSLSSIPGSNNFYHYNNEVKTEYYLNDCEPALNL